MVRNIGFGSSTPTQRLKSKKFILINRIIFKHTAVTPKVSAFGLFRLTLKPDKAHIFRRLKVNYSTKPFAHAIGEETDPYTLQNDHYDDAQLNAPVHAQE